ncbi:hypothetical protein [Citrobacter freundii]|uniref:hypothetical protein n=1 Tax=Citrobacter freundii TaxID=546 RepID=UPI0019090266|nr:hypothetical protein [Citrobacter freundii]MBJ8931638.1 hypothetical protein [Citrobacter freundii]
MFNSFNGPDGFTLDASYCGFIPDPSRRPFICPHLTYLRLKDVTSLGENVPNNLVLKTERICLVSSSINDGFYSLGTVVGHPGHSPFVVYEDHEPEILGGNIEQYLHGLTPDMISHILRIYPVFLFDIIAIKLSEFSYNFDKINEYLASINSLEFSCVPEML